MSTSARLATLFGLGRVGRAPGTVASLVAVILALLLGIVGGRYLVLVAGLAATAAGVWASERYVRDSRKRDPSECVIDELAGQWIACAFAPLSAPAYLVAFVLFRLFDILKPWPISRLEELGGGLGVMADDIGAAILAGLIVAALAYAKVF